jgi:hypothetical protein
VFSFLTTLKFVHLAAPLNLEGTILFGDAGPDRERSTGCGTRNSPLSLSIISKAARTEIWCVVFCDTFLPILTPLEG